MPSAPPDLAASALRTLVLYSLTQFQLGHATTIRVSLEGSAFGIAYDGPGHPLDKTLEGSPYLRFIYTHFDYPFEAGRAAPVQLQGLGMSLVHALCSTLQLTVRKRDETFTLGFRDGQEVARTREPEANAETGITISARLRPELPPGGTGSAALEAWLRGLLQVHPTLRLYFNGQRL